MNQMKEADSDMTILYVRLAYYIPQFDVYRMIPILTITPQDANLQYEQSRGRKKEILISNGLEVVAVAGDFYVNKVMK